VQDFGRRGGGIDRGGEMPGSSARRGCWKGREDGAEDLRKELRKIHRRSAGVGVETSLGLEYLLTFGAWGLDSDDGALRGVYCTVP
jgi:hypothetical protein